MADSYSDPLESKYDVDQVYYALMHYQDEEELDSPTAEDPQPKPTSHGVHYFNTTFQQLLREKDGAEKFLGLQQVIREFVEVAETFVRPQALC